MEADYRYLLRFGRVFLAAYVERIAGHRGWFIGQSLQVGCYRKLIDRRR